MKANLKIITVSEKAKLMLIPEYPPLSENNLDSLENTGKRGLVLHRMVGIDDNDPDPLPVHMHPSVWLSLIQEIRRWREGEVAE